MGVEGVAGVGDFTPLKTAAMNGDLDTVVKSVLATCGRYYTNNTMSFRLCMLGSDINEADKYGKIN